MGEPNKYHRWLVENLEKPFLRAELLQLENPDSEKNPPLMGVITSTVTLIVLMALWGGIN